MAKIRKDELVETGLLDGLKLAAKEGKELTDLLITSLKALNETTILLKKTAESIKGDIAGVDRKKIQDVEKLNRLTKEATQAAIDKEKVQKSTLQTEQQLEKNRQEQIKTQVLITKEKERLAKITAKNVKATKDENSEYKKLVVQTRKVKNESKELAAQMIRLERAGKGNTREYRLLSRSYKNTAKEAQKLDKSLKRVDSTVGDNFRNVGNYKKSLNGLKTTMLSMVGAFGAMQLIRKSTDVLIEFDEKLADIAKTTGLTTEGAKKVSQELLKIDTRTSITSLQELASAAGRLGITGEKNIVGFVNAADKAFVALGDDLNGTAEEIATNLGKIAGVFGDEAEFGAEVAINKTGSAMNELAANSKAAAGPIFDFTTRLAGVAAQAGISQADVQALGALFDEAGQSVEVASSTMNKLLPALSSNQKEFAETAGMTAEAFGELLAENPIEALKQVAKGAKSSEKGLGGLVETLESFGVESARATGIVGVLANGTERLTELQKISNDAFNEGTSLSDEAAIKNDTLGASIEKLGNELIRVILGADDAAGVTDKLKAAVDFLARNIKNVIFVVKAVIKGFIAYKTALIVIAIRQKALSLNFKRLIPQMRIFARNLVKSGKGMLGMGKGMKGAAKGVKGFGRSLNAIPLIAVIGLLVELASALWDVVTNADAAAEATERMAAEAEARASKRAADEEKAQARSAERQKRLTDENSKLERARKKDVAEKTKTQAEADASTLKGKKAILNVLKKEIEAEATALRSARNTAKSRLEFLEGADWAKLSEENKKAWAKSAGVPRNFASAQLELNTQIGHSNKAISELQTEYDSYHNELLDVTVDEIVATSERKKTTKSIRKVNDQFSDQIKLTKELNALKKEQLKIDKDLSELDLKDDLREQNKLLEAQIAVRKKEALESDVLFTGDKDAAQFLGLTEITEIKRILAEKERLEIESEKKTLEIEKTLLQNSHDEKFRLLQASLDKELREKLAQANLSEDQKKSITDGFDREQADLNTLKLERQDILDGKIEVKTRETEEKITAIKEGSATEQKEIIEDLNDTALTASAERLAKEEEAAAAIIDQERSNAEARKAIIDALTEHMVKRADERIEKLDDEIAAHQKTADLLRGLAASGNILAKESLAEENRIIAEKNAEKAKEEKRKQRIILASTVLSSYNQKLGEGKSGTEALLEAIAEVGTLTAFLNALPTFKDGIENTGQHGQGIDGQGGFLSVLHPEERVLTKEQNSQIGNMSNQDLAQIAENHRLSDHVDSGIQLHMGFDSQRVVDELMNIKGEMKSVKQSIDDKEVPSYAVGETFQKSFEIIESMKSNKGKTQNTFIVKPN